MPRLRIVISLLLCLVLIVATPAAQNKVLPIGMVLQTKGDVQIQRGREKKPARLGELLYAGDQVAAVSGEATLVFCPSTERVNLKSNSLVELTSQSIRVLKGIAPARQKAAACALPHVALGAESMERVGALRARGYPPILLYVGGPITNSHPLFHWGPIKDAKLFRVFVRDEMGTVIWEQETNSQSIAYPESAPALAAKIYQWEVRAEGDGKIVAQQTANFEVKPDAKHSRMPSNDTAARMLAATELENAGYYAEAADLFRLLRDANPNDTRLTRHLAWLYWKAGLVTAMNEELGKLKAKEPK
ncbi:MAG TPA: hypothetical protein VGQ81_00670 [Acidobacteriota bacterium]|nr:hypothetical protein [Acidobacteriota bacterium]